jgi:hypothetical protein
VKLLGRGGATHDQVYSAILSLVSDLDRDESRYCAELARALGLRGHDGWVYLLDHTRRVSDACAAAERERDEARAELAALRPTQPPPNGGEGDCWQELIDSVGPEHPLRDAMIARRAVGIARYGQPLRRDDGRDAALDLREELLDAAAYAQRITQYGLPARLLAIAADPRKWLDLQVGLEVQAGNLRTVERELRRHFGMHDDVVFTESELVDAIGELARGKADLREENRIERVARLVVETALPYPVEDLGGLGLPEQLAFVAGMLDARRSS